MNRKLKKYNLKYEYLKLEDEETKEELESYIKEFNDRFSKYYNRPSPKPERDREVWVNEQTGEVRDDPPPNFADNFKEHFENFKKEQAEREKVKLEKIEELKNKPEKLKKLYKKLAAKVHPDRGGTNQLFQEVNSAYESNNLMALLTKAGEYEIDYEVDNSDTTILESNLKQLEDEIARMKDTIAWTWSTGDIESKKFVIKRVESETGHTVEEEDLPDELKKEVSDDTEPKLLN